MYLSLPVRVVSSYQLVKRTHFPCAHVVMSTKESINRRPLMFTQTHNMHKVKSGKAKAKRTQMNIMNKIGGGAGDAQSETLVISQ